MPHSSSQNVNSPRAQKRPTQHIYHGHILHDDFAWLRAENWQDVLRHPKKLPQDIRAYIEAENDYADFMLKPFASLRRSLEKEMRARIKEDDADVPQNDGAFSYFERYREGGEHPLYCRTLRDGGAEHILLDGDVEAEGKAFFDIGGCFIAPDHARLAWSVDEAGSEYYTIKTRRCDDVRDASDLIIETDGTAVWDRASQGFYYIRLDEHHRPSRVFYHRCGDDPAHDQLIYEEMDAGWFLNLYPSAARDWLIIHAHDHDSTEVWLVSLRGEERKPLCVAPRQKGIRTSVAPYHDRLFIKTNWGGADDFRIMETDINHPDPSHWRDIVPHRAGCLIVSFALTQHYLTRLEREDGLPRLVVRHIASGQEQTIAFDEEAYALSLIPEREFETTNLRFTYSSMTTPRQTFDYDMARAERILRKQQDIPSGHDPETYVTRRIYAPSHDGALVPVTLLYAKSTQINASTPVFLTGYGAYGSPYPASFSENRLSLVDRGFIYGIAHIRGGTDKGWAWYEQGKLRHKANTFHDFIAAARYLIAQGMTSAKRIVASGGSAGGMLMGAVANMAPELFAGIIADVPFVDVMNTMLDDTLPLTPPEWLEWGNPISDAEAFETMRAYSPYDNICAQDYPAILALSGLTDPRVTYWEPTKWVARLRATMTGGGPILLKTNMKAGHGGSSGRFDQLADVALEYVFALGCINQSWPKA